MQLNSTALTKLTITAAGRKANLIPKFHNDSPVLHFTDIDLLHKRASGGAKANFFRSRSCFNEGEDFSIIEPRQYVLTATGYQKLSSIFKDPKYQEVQREVITRYYGAEYREGGGGVLTITDPVKMAEFDVKMAEVESRNREADLRRAKMILRTVEDLRGDLTPEELRRLVAAVVELLAGEADMPGIELPGMAETEPTGPKHCEATMEVEPIDLFVPAIVEAKEKDH